MLTWVEVNKKAIQHNLLAFRKLIGQEVLLMPVLKSNAYGHGILEIGKICDQDKNVDRICVVRLEEAVDLIKSGIKKTIMILSFYEQDEEKAVFAAKNNVVFPVYSKKQADFLNKIAKISKKKIKVHIKLDTGTTRVGVLPKEKLETAKFIKTKKFLELEGLFSHFAASESDPTFTNEQLSIFNSAASKLKGQGIDIKIKHFACSAAAILYPETRLSAIRTGISFYGLYPDEKSKKIIDLKPALTLNTKIVHIKTVPPKTSISYGRTFTTKRVSKIAVLPVGYWDGLDRRLSNKLEMLVKGKRCPVRGRICMNMTMIDVTDVKNIKTGDTVTIIGQQGSNKVTVDEIAKIIGTINYEVVTRINPTIKRIIK